MRTFIALAATILVLSACSQPSKNVGPTTAETRDSAKEQSFFPVTSYIRGQLFEVKNKGVTPLYYVTINNHTDSSWLKIEDFEKAVSEFLTPRIDSANLINLFTEKNFLDQTIAAYTFTYDPAGELPDSIKLRHWDVYIDAESGKVRRLYMLKEVDARKTLQLTWQSNKYCKMVTIASDQSGNSSVEKEELITWEY